MIIERPEACLQDRVERGEASFELRLSGCIVVESSKVDPWVGDGFLAFECMGLALFGRTML